MTCVGGRGGCRGPEVLLWCAVVEGGLDGPSLEPPSIISGPGQAHWGTRHSIPWWLTYGESSVCQQMVFPLARLLALPFRVSFFCSTPVAPTACVLFSHSLFKRHPKTWLEFRIESSSGALPVLRKTPKSTWWSRAGWSCNGGVGGLGVKPRGPQDPVLHRGDLLSLSLDSFSTHSC